jgi:hypothetical protein
VRSAAASIKLDDFAAPDDNTDLNATTTAHGLAPKAVAPATGLLNVLGIANGETVRTDKALFDATNPAALGSVGTGSAVVAARRDHVHAMPSAADVGAAAATSFIAGAGALTGPAAPLTIGTAAAAATGDFAAAAHAHEGTAILSTGEAGGTKFLREDGDGTSSWQETLKDIGEAAYSLGSSIAGTLTIDLANGHTQYGTLSGNVTAFAITNGSAHAATAFTLVLTKSTESIVWASGLAYWLDAAPDLSAAGTYLLDFRLVNGSWYGIFGGARVAV